MTLDPIPYASPAGATPIDRPRRGVLIAFGVVSIVIGALLAGWLMLLAVALIVAMGYGSGLILSEMPLMAYVAVAGVVGMAILFIWAGIDSIRCKRWVRPVVIAVGSLTVVSSSLMIVFLAVGIGATWSASASIPPTTMPTFSSGPEVSDLAISIGVFSFFGVLVPGLFVWIYASEPVRRTLEAYDRRNGPSWTERCPTRVFVAAAGLLVGGLSICLTATSVGATTFFGVYVEGALGILLTALAGFALVAASVLMYLNRPVGWWLATFVVTLGFVSGIATLLHLGVAEFYRQGGSRDEELSELTQSPVTGGPGPIVLAILTGVACVAYLLWVRSAAGARLDLRRNARVAAGAPID